MKTYRLTIFLVMLTCGILYVRYAGIQVLKPSLGLDSVYLSSVDVFTRIHEQPLHSPFNEMIDLKMDWYGNVQSIPGQKKDNRSAADQNFVSQFSLVQGHIDFTVLDYAVLPSGGQTNLNPLSFARIYHSENINSKGVIGFGWRAFWEYELYKLEEKFYLKKPEGKIVTFEFDTKLNRFVVLNKKDNVYVLQQLKDSVIVQEESGVQIEFERSPGIEQFAIHRMSYKNGQSCLFKRNAAGLPSEINEEHSGRVTSFQYHEDTDLIKSVKFPSGFLIQLHYDNNQNLIEVKTDLKHSEIYAYDSMQNVHLITNIKSPEVSAALSYEDKRLSQITYANGDYVKVDRDFIQGVCKVRSIHGGTFVYWNKSRYVWEVRGPLDFSQVYKFNDLGQLVSFIDSQSRENQYSWDDAGHLIQRESVYGIELFDYEMGNLVSYTDPNGARYVYRYENDLLKKSTYPDGSAITYIYEGAVLSRKTNDAINETVSYVYNTERLLIQEIFSNGEILYYEYNDDGYMTKQSSNRGFVDTFEWLGQYLISMGSVDLDGTKLKEIMFEYDFENNVMMEKDHKNIKTEYHFNGNGGLAKIVNPDGRKATYKRSVDDLILEYKIDGGNEKQWVYDGLGRLVKIEMGSKVLAQYMYDKTSGIDISVKSNQFSKVKYFNGEAIDMACARNYQPSWIKFSNGREWHMEYGSGKRLVSFQDNWRGLFTFQYDPNGWLRYILDDSQTAVSQFEHDMLGNILSIVKGENGYFFEYHNGRPVMLFENFDSIGVQWKWNSANQIEAFVNKDGTRYSYDYDLRGNIIGKGFENMYQQQYYTSKMLPESKFDMMGRGFSLSYEDSGMIKEYSPVKGEKVSWIYDLAGRTKRVTGDYPFELTWSNFDQLVKIAFDKKNLMLLAYNDLGQVVKKTYPGFIVMQNHFDENGNLTGVSENGLDSIVYEHDAYGRLAVIKYPNGLVTSVLYNPSGYEESRVTVDSTGKEVFKRVYQYDSSDRVLKIVTERGVQLREFDSLGNIVTETLDNKSKTRKDYKYDNMNYVQAIQVHDEKTDTLQIETGMHQDYYKFSVINKGREQSDKNTVLRVSLHGTAAQDAGFLEVDKQVVQLKNNRFSLDQLQLPAGEKEIEVRYINALGKEYRNKFKLQFRPGTQGIYLFDRAGKLYYKSIDGRILQYLYNDDLTVSKVQSAIGDQIIEYTYKYYGNGLLAEREIFNVSTQSSKRTQFIFDEKANMVGEFDKNEAGFDSLYMYNNHNEIVYRMDRANRKYYYHLDKDGSVIGITDPQGDVVASYSYDYFGGFSHRAEKISNPFYYLGKYFESTTGFYFTKGHTYHDRSVFLNHVLESSTSDFKVMTPDVYIKERFPDYHLFKNAGEGFPFTDVFVMKTRVSPMKDFYSGRKSLSGALRPLIAHLKSGELWFDFMYENPVSWNEIYFSAPA